MYLKRKGLAYCLLAALLSVLIWMPSLNAQDKLSKSELMYYQDGEGRILPVRNSGDWERRRASILEGLQEAMGKLPDMSGFPTLGPVTREVVQEDGYVRRKLTLQVEKDDLLWCNLLIPDSLEEKNPAILALHPTHPAGKGDTVGLSGRENRNYGQELAQLGFVVLVPDYPSFGDESDYDFNSDSYVSGSMKGIVNHIRCVDYLQSLPFVDPERIGVIGHSLGGHNAIFVAVFDPRIKVIVSSCGWTPFHDYYQGNIKGWASDRYIPLLNSKFGLDPDRVPFDFYGVIAALAPRPFLSVSPLHDSNFDVGGVRKAIAEAGKVYQLLGAADRLRVEYPDSEHDFIPAMREEAYRFLAEWLDFGIKAAP